MTNDIDLADLQDIDFLLREGRLSCIGLADLHLEAIARTRLVGEGSSPVAFLADPGTGFAEADARRAGGTPLSAIDGMGFLRGPSGREGSRIHDALVAAGAVPLGDTARLGRNPFGGCPVEGVHAAVSLGLAAFAAGGSDGGASGGAGRAGVVGCAGFSARSVRDAQALHSIAAGEAPRHPREGRGHPVRVVDDGGSREFSMTPLLLRLSGFDVSDAVRPDGVEVRRGGSAGGTDRFVVSLPGRVDEAGLLQAVLVSSPADRPDAAFAVAACLEREFGLRERVLRMRREIRAERAAA